LTTEGLAANKGLSLDTSEEVAQGSKQQENGGGNQTARAADNADKLQSTHDTIGARAHVVGRNLANELVELGRSWADSEEERDLNKQDDERRCDGKSAKDDSNNIEREDIGDSNSQTNDHGNDPEPLSINAEVSRLEFFFESHIDSLRPTFVFGIREAEGD
jgi:hypothetical protein